MCFLPPETHNYNSAARENRKAIGLIPSRRAARMPLLFLSSSVTTNGQDNEQRERRRKTNSNLFVHYAGIFSQSSNRSCTTIRTQIIFDSIISIFFPFFFPRKLHTASIKNRFCKAQYLPNEKYF